MWLCKAAQQSRSQFFQGLKLGLVPCNSHCKLLGKPTRKAHHLQVLCTMQYIGLPRFKNSASCTATREQGAVPSFPCLASMSDNMTEPTLSFQGALHKALHWPAKTPKIVQPARRFESKELYRLFHVLQACLELDKGVSLASDILLMKLLGLQHPHLKHSLMPV